MTEFKIPELGENVASGDVTRVLVNVGDTIKRDQPVIELETDKATIEVPSSVAGVVKEIRVKPGDKVQVGTSVLSVEESGAAQPAAAAPAQAEVAPDTPPKTAPQPQPAPMEERAAAAEAGGQQQNVPPMRRPETDKPGTVEPDEEAPAPQTRRAEVVAMARPARAGEPAPTTTRAGGAQAAPVEERRPAAPAAPSVRRLAREVGVEIHEIQGTGPGGRISQEDVKEHARRILSSVGTSRGAGRGAAASALPDFAKWGEIERQAMSNIRRVTAERLSQAWNTIPHVTQYEKADITALEALRKKYAPQVEKQGGKLTVTAILAKVLAAAVKTYPQFNASVDGQSNEIVYKRYVNVGVAVDTERGLLVPVIRNVDQKNITQVAVEIQQAAEKARARKLSLEDMEGGGITITNLGGIGGTFFTPIVNWPEVAILGVSRAVMEPVYVDGTFEPRLMLPLSLSYDHRLIDGADAMRFLRWVAEALEQPFLLSLQG